MMNRCLILLLYVSLFFTGCASTVPSDKGAGRIPVPAQAMFLVYDKGLNGLSAVRSGACPMYPSCSAYSREAFSRHGLMKGWWMTFDRLLRCGRDEMNLAPRILVHGGWKAYDPVSHNDHWWYEPEKSTPPTPGP